MILDAGDGDPAGDGAYQKGKLAATPARRRGLRRGGQLGRPRRRDRSTTRRWSVSLAVLGSLVLDVDGSRLDARFLDSAGIVEDAFSIEKPAFGALPCSDHIDNDRDGFVDGADFDCRISQSESIRMCGLGFEIALVAPLLQLLSVRRRRSLRARAS